VLNSALTHNQGNGIGVQNSEATVERCLIADTLPNGDGVLGDGIFLDYRGQPTSIFVHATRIERSARAGISSSAGSWR